MPTFEYQALNPAGERISGTVLGPTMEQALGSLSKDGLQVERIHQSVLAGDPLSQPEPKKIERPAAPAAQPPPPKVAPPVVSRNYFATSVAGPLVGKVPLSSLSFFYRQFGTMLDAGVPIVQALDTLSRQGRSPKLGRVVAELKGHVEAGREVSAGMQRYPEVFPPLALSMIRAGEEGGFLVQSYKLLAEYTEQEIALRNLIRRLTFYPKLVVVASIFIILGANGVIAYFGKSGGLASPLTSPATWVILGPVLVGIFLFFRVGLANPRVKYNWDLFVLKLPFGVGRTVKEFAMSKFGRALSALYKGGVPVHRAISLAGDACGNEYLRSKIAPAGKVLESGAGITETLRSTAAFNPIVMDMVATGETTGNLDQMLGRMSDFYEDDAKTRAEQIAHVFGVVCLIAVGIYVLLCILIPAYSGYAGAAVGAGGE